MHFKSCRFCLYWKISIFRSTIGLKLFRPKARTDNHSTKYKTTFYFIVIVFDMGINEWTKRFPINSK